MNKLVFNRACFFGSESINVLVDEIQNNHFQKAFIITDNGLIECGIAQKVISLLMKNKIPSVIFSDVTPEPTVRDVKNALVELKRSNADFILAIGGGSPIDTAKAVSIIHTNPKYADVVSLAGHKDNLNTPLPIIAIPTTAGSAAEASKSFVVSDDIIGKKIICFNDKCLPIETIIDAELMSSMPDIVTLSSGFDALVHAIESLLSNKANTFTKTLSREAIKLIANNLPLCYDEPTNLEARENMSYAEYMAGIAYSNSGLGLAHSIAHGVAGKYNIPHGIVLAMTMCAVLKYNMYSPSSAEYKTIAESFGVDTSSLKKDEICRKAIKAFEDFKDSFNIPKKLSDYGIKEADLDEIALHSFDDACTESNPREATMTDIYTILKKIL
ncbi:MAG: iron-containing alcohol dehydrogenase [Clostridia bacterium]|nr:iron-containing alcohol dehydrogenase [Clostridia bacterium]